MPPSCGIVPDSHISPTAWAIGFLTTEPPGRPCGRIFKRSNPLSLTTHQAVSGDLSLDFQKVALQLPVPRASSPRAGKGWGAGTVFVRPALVYRAPWARQVRSHKGPRPRWRRCESSTWGIEGVHEHKREIPGCRTPRGMQLDSLGLILFMPFEMFICVFQNLFLSLLMEEFSFRSVRFCCQKQVSQS